MDSLRPLGRSGMFVSPIGLGTVKLGRNQGVSYPAPFELPSDDQVVALFRAAADLGVNLIDTAPAYGASEERIGAIMARHDWFGGRRRWVVSTKVGEEFEHGRSRFDFSPAAVRASVECSLRRLRIDVLDLVLIHSSGDDENILASSGAVESLRDLKAGGLIRAIGISSKTVAGGLRGVRMGLDALMVTLNSADASQLTVIRAAGAEGVGILIKKALISGHAAGAPGADPIRDAMSFVFRSAPGDISSVVVGTLSPDHLRANVNAARQAIS